MVFTLTTTHQPATDLGYLLHKHPDRMAEVDFGSGKAMVFAPTATNESCTFALAASLDTVGMVRSDAPMDQYINDRAWTANSFLSVALGRCFSTAMSGRSKERQELADTPIPLAAVLSAVRAQGGERMIRRVFEPLGMAVSCQELAAPGLPSSQRLHRVELSATMKLAEFLNRVYILIPVLDAEKHYWVAQDEIDKLLRRGEGWLAGHPDREMIIRRYLRRSARLANEAIDRLRRLGDGGAAEDADAPEEEAETSLRQARLHDTRLSAVAETLAKTGAKTVLDLGCGSGKLLRLLVANSQFSRIVGMDISIKLLWAAERRIGRNSMSEDQRERVSLIHGSLLYLDDRLKGFDAAALVEVIEHLDEERLRDMETVVFGHARPAAVILTTPNREYNALYEGLEEGGLRHSDHRFEWTRAEFAAWLDRVCQKFGYTSRSGGLGVEHPEAGFPTQMAVLTRTAGR